MHLIICISNVKIFITSNVGFLLINLIKLFVICIVGKMYISLHNLLPIQAAAKCF